ncbi:hypothetical protein CROQUDRAFT_95756 [Cronartium quercuum f. sp. fusiforme G11]|uniref:Uncharacterized protein n=1 Tax=Cronartium quercuum f. sp. fusiforme G11 TaxID=708437 RepID=A0A9P6NHW0_9BASI|nr:hypothetical protein CROQUDRAFT_95756 [Cronartium quercuum f. sp. fusiforme G11]
MNNFETKHITEANSNSRSTGSEASLSRRLFRNDLGDYRSAISFIAGKTNRNTLPWDLMLQIRTKRSKKSDALAQALDMFNTRVDTARILDYNLDHLKQAYDPNLSLNPYEADRGQIDSALERIKW